MRYLHLLVEGQTEESLADALLRPHFASAGWAVSISIINTKPVAGGPSHRGGVSRWSKIEAEIKRPLASSHFTLVTTLFDYYGFPADAPGMADRPSGSPFDRVGCLAGIGRRASRRGVGATEGQPGFPGSYPWVTMDGCAMT